MTLSDARAQRRLVRILSMRGTVHVLTPNDALIMRPWVQPALDAISRGNAASRGSRHVASADLIAAASAALAGGPLPATELGERLAKVFPMSTACWRVSGAARGPISHSSRSAGSAGSSAPASAPNWTGSKHCSPADLGFNGPSPTCYPLAALHPAVGVTSRRQLTCQQPVL